MRSPSLPETALDDYEGVADPAQIRRVRDLGTELGDVSVLHVNSAASGGGVAELLRSFVPLSVDVGVDATWAVIEADDDFFAVTKAIHDGLQGDPRPLTEQMRATYRRVTAQNAAELDRSYDVVVLHDPQPLGMLDGIRDTMPEATVIWRCHLDLTDPAPAYRAFVSTFTDRVDHAVFSRSAYESGADVPESSVVHPSIDPLSPKNRPLSNRREATAHDQLDPISFDAPLVTQVSRFDPWKDQFGTLDAFRRVREARPNVQLALVGSVADDDPQGAAVYDSVREAADDPSVTVLRDLPDAAVNYLQRESDVVVQKSIREGFGLVVSEALWKRTPVVGSTVGGIPLQVEDGHSGYLVDPDDVAGAADRIARLLTDDRERAAFGRRGRQRVRERFLLPRQVADLHHVLTGLLDR